MMVLGTTFLKQFYSVYDMDQKTISLALDKTSNGMAKIHESNRKNLIYILMATQGFLLLLMIVIALINRKSMKKRANKPEKELKFAHNPDAE